MLRHTGREPQIALPLVLALLSVSPAGRMLIASPRRPPMTLCPIALVAGCQKCPVVSVCPLKTVIGDAPKPGAGKAAARKKK